MEFILEMKNSVLGGKAEKVIGIVLSVVLACGVLASVYHYIENGIQINGPEKEVTDLKKEAEETSIVLETKVLESSIAEENERITTKEEKVIELAEPIKKIETLEVTEEIETEGSVSDIIVNDTIENEIVSDNITEIENGIVSDTITDKMEITTDSDLVPEKETVTEGIVTDIVTDGEIVENEPADAPVEIVSPFLIDEADMIYGFLPEHADLSSGTLELPSEGCVGIRKGTFAGCTEYIAEICVPAGITEIENGALTELASLEWITVDAGNPYYTAIDGILFSNEGTHLSAYPPARVGAYMISAGVASIAENAFQNTSLVLIDLRQCGLSENCLLNISESCSIIK